MISEDMIADMIRSISGSVEVDIDTPFAEIGLDSTHMVEVLIELEMKLDIDVLSDELNFDDFQSARDIYDYVKRIVSSA